MDYPFHAMSGRKEMTPERIVGIGFVGLLHIVAIWAIMNGLGQKFYHAVIQPDITLIIPTSVDRPPPPKPHTSDLPHLDVPLVTDERPVAPPPIVVQEDQHQPPAKPGGTVADAGPAAPPAPDTFVAGVMSTHTIPPYPLLASRLGEHGKVQLHLAISAQGAVTSADVVQSSGFADLDQAAIKWVIANWKYKPATRAGSPVAGSTDAIVVFSLKNAR